MLLRFVKHLSDQMGSDSPPKHMTSDPGPEPATALDEPEGLQVLTLVGRHDLRR